MSSSPQQIRPSFLERAIATAIISVSGDSLLPGSFGVKSLEVLVPNLRYILTLDLEGLDASSLNRIAFQINTIVTRDAQWRGRYATTQQPGQILIDAVETGPGPNDPSASGEYLPLLSSSGPTLRSIAPVQAWTYLRVGRIVHVQGSFSCSEAIGAPSTQLVTATMPLGAALADGAFSLLSGAIVDNRDNGLSDLAPTRTAVLAAGPNHLAQGFVSDMSTGEIFNVDVQYELPKTSPIVQPVGQAALHFVTASLISGISGV